MGPGSFAIEQVAIESLLGLPLRTRAKEFDERRKLDDRIG